MRIYTLQTRLIFSYEKDKQDTIDMLKAEQTLWNFISKYVYMAKTLNPKTIYHAMYKELRKLYPRYPTSLIVVALRSVRGTYCSVKSNKYKLNSHCNKKKLCSIYGKSLFRYKNSILELTKIGKKRDRIKCKPYLYPQLTKFLDKYKFTSIRLSYKDNEIWCTFFFKVPTPETKPVNSALGIDLGIRRFVTTSEGNIYQDKEFLARKRKLRYLKRVLNSKKKNSHSARTKLKKIRDKEKNANLNFVHHLTKKILKTESNVIVMEKLDTKKLKSKQNKFQNKNRISQVPFSMIREILTYKAKLLGKQVILVNPAFTSQTDHTDGKIGVRKGCRFYGTHKIFDADVNAAINIAKRSKHPVSSCVGLDGQAKINTPIVGCLKTDGKSIILIK